MSWSYGNESILQDALFMIYKTVRATFHLTIFMRGQRATGKIQRNNHHHGNCEPSLTGKTSSVSLIFTHQGPRRVFESGVAKKCFEPRSGEKYFLGPSRGVWGMLPQKILKTKCLRLA